MRRPLVSLRDLTDIFDRSSTILGGTLPIRKTSAGVWVPTPISVIAAAADVLTELELVGERAPAGPVIDAGTGDGRVAAVLAAFEPTRPFYGIEADAMFHRQAIANVEELRSKGLDRGRVEVIEGDYCEVTTYEERGIDLSSVRLCLNYPDGHERELAQFVAERVGGRATLCLLTHDSSVSVDALRLQAQRSVRVKDEQEWRLSVYRRRS